MSVKEFAEKLIKAYDEAFLKGNKKPLKRAVEVGLHEMNKLAKLFLALLITALLVIVSSCGKAAFELSNLTVSPTDVVSGESTTISVDIKNTGNAEGTCPVVLKIDQAQIDDQNVTIKPGASHKVSFTVTISELGSHTASVGNLTQTLTVLRPAEFKVAALKVSPTGVLAGRSATVTADVTNIGEVEGDYQVTLKVNNKDVETKKVSLTGGATETVSFTFNLKEAGSYTIGVDSLSQTLTVLKPAEFRVTALRVSPTEVLAGSSATVMVDVTNVGDVRGDYQVTLKVDNEDVGTKKVSLAGGATETVSFTLLQDQGEGGTYDVSVDGQSGTLVVKVSPGVSLPPFPGNTIADLTLQADVLGIIRLFEIVAGNPNPTIMNTRVTQALIADGTWAERWIVERSGVAVAYDIKFQRDPQGGTYFSVSRAETP